MVPYLVQFIQQDRMPDLQFEAAWALTNVCASEATAAVAAAGAVAPLVAGLMHADAEVRDQCVWCLGNIAGDAPALRDAVLATPGAVDALLLNLRHPESLKLLRNATWAMSNFCRGKPAPAAAAVAPLLPALAHLAALEDNAVVADALWGLSFLFDSDDGSTTSAVLALAPGLAARTVALMAHADDKVATPAQRIVGSLTSGCERHTQAAIDGGALPGLVPLLRSGRRAVRREACWAVSNIAAGTHVQIGALLATRGMLDAVLEAMRGAEWHVRKEAAWVICNAAAAGSPAHVCTLVAGGVVEPLVDVLASDDERMLTVVLDAVAAILAIEARFKADGNPAAAMCRFAENFEEHGLIVRLEELQSHASTDVYDKAYAILTSYYADDGADEAAPTPAAANSTKAVADAPASYAFTGMTFA